VPAASDRSRASSRRQSGALERREIAHAGVDMPTRSSSARLLWQKLLAGRRVDIVFARRRHAGDPPGRGVVAAAIAGGDSPSQGKLSGEGKVESFARADETFGQRNPHRRRWRVYAAARNRPAQCVSLSTSNSPDPRASPPDRVGGGEKLESRGGRALRPGRAVIGGVVGSRHDRNQPASGTTTVTRRTHSRGAKDVGSGTSCPAASTLRRGEDSGRPDRACRPPRDSFPGTLDLTKNGPKLLETVVSRKRSAFNVRG